MLASIPYTVCHGIGQFSTPTCQRLSRQLDSADPGPGAAADLGFFEVSVERLMGLIIQFGSISFPWGFKYFQTKVFPKVCKTPESRSRPKHLRFGSTWSPIIGPPYTRRVWGISHSRRMVAGRNL